MARKPRLHSPINADNQNVDMLGTPFPIQQIADRLHTGSRKSVGLKLHAWEKSNE
jgi:hypothetical protein